MTNKGRETAPPSKREKKVVVSKKESPQSRYDKLHTERVAIKLNKGTDADILDKLSKVPNKQGYIKQLIRADITNAI